MRTHSSRLCLSCIVAGARTQPRLGAQPARSIPRRRYVARQGGCGRRRHRRRSADAPHMRPAGGDGSLPLPDGAHDRQRRKRHPDVSPLWTRFRFDHEVEELEPARHRQTRRRPRRAGHAQSGEGQGRRGHHGVHREGRQDLHRFGDDQGPPGRRFGFRLRRIRRSRGVRRRT